MIDCPESFWTRLLVPGNAVLCSSKHTFDAWSVTHAAWGALFRRTVTSNTKRALALHTLWELVENTSVVINLFQRVTLYSGDSFINSFGDTIAFYAGFRYPQLLEALIIASLLVFFNINSGVQQVLKNQSTRPSSILRKNM
jgi:hypothetical protein